MTRRLCILHDTDKFSYYFMDDMNIKGDDPHGIQFVKHHLQQQSQMKELGPLR